MADDIKSRKNEQSEEAQSPGRRKALKALLAAGGVAAVSALPAKWSPAVVEAVADPGNCGEGHGRGRGRGHDGRGRGRGHDCDEPPTTTAAPTTPPPTTPLPTTLAP